MRNTQVIQQYIYEELEEQMNARNQAFKEFMLEKVGQLEYKEFDTDIKGEDARAALSLEIQSLHDEYPDIFPLKDHIQVDFYLRLMQDAEEHGIRSVNDTWFPWADNKVGGLKEIFSQAASNAFWDWVAPRLPGRKAEYAAERTARQMAANREARALAE